MYMNRPNDPGGGVTWPPIRGHLAGFRFYPYLEEITREMLSKVFTDPNRLI